MSRGDPAVQRLAADVQPPRWRPLIAAVAEARPDVAFVHAPVSGTHELFRTGQPVIFVSDPTARSR